MPNLYSIELNGKEFLQKNLPGNDGYGQVGTCGLPGNMGNSIYYTAFDLSNESDMEACLSLINAGKELTNNEKYIKGKSIQYNNYDYIIDKNGIIFLLQKNEESEFELSIFRNLFKKAKLIDHLTMYIDVNVDNPEQRYYYKQTNEDYIGKEFDTVTSSPYLYHRNSYNKNIYGFYIIFKVSLAVTAEESTEENEARVDVSTFKYTLLLPNGQKLEAYYQGTEYPMFIDIRNLYGMASTLYDGVCDSEYVSINDNKEYSPETVASYANFVKNNCIPYVEAYTSTGKIYRKYKEIDDPWKEI